MRASPRRRFALSAVLVMSGLIAGAAGPAAAAPSPTVTTVVSGLDNPRDLAFGSGDDLYVAEAGHGGNQGCFSDPEIGENCFGFTSGVSRVLVNKHDAYRVESGLASMAAPDGTFATGIDGISVLNGDIYGIMTGATAFLDLLPPSVTFDPATRVKLTAQLGRLFLFDLGEPWRRLGKVGDVDFAWSGLPENINRVPGGQFPDANPYGVLALRDAIWVVDAASNTIDRVSRSGEVTVRQFIPNPPVSDAVPTCIDQGPDGALYIGELTGAGNAPGASTVWRYDPGDSTPLTKWATGLTAVTGCGFDEDGQFYATEFSTLGLDNAAPGTGAVVRVAPHSTSPETVVSGLNFPGGFAAGLDSLFVSNWSIAPADNHGGPTGEVLRISTD
jgi:hypothetical protein